MSDGSRTEDFSKGWKTGFDVGYENGKKAEKERILSILQGKIPDILIKTGLGPTEILLVRSILDTEAKKG